MPLFRRAVMNRFQISDSLRLLSKNARRLQKLDKSFFKSGKKLKNKKFTPDYVAQLELKYVKGKKPNPAKFKKKFHKLCDKYFLLFYNEWMRANIEIWRLYDEVAVVSSKQEVEDLESVEKILREAKDRAGQGYFGHATIAEFEKSFRHFVQETQKLIKRSYYNAQRAHQGKDERGSFFTRLRGERGLVKQIRKIASKKITHDEKRLEKIRTELRSELSGNAVHQAFLPLLDEYLAKEGVLIVHIAHIKWDICELIIRHNENQAEVLKHIYPFGQLAMNSHEITSQQEAMLRETLSRMGQGMSQQSIDFVNHELADEKGLFIKTREILQHATELENRLNANAQRVAQKQSEISAWERK